MGGSRDPGALLALPGSRTLFYKYLSPPSPLLCLSGLCEAFEQWNRCYFCPRWVNVRCGPAVPEIMAGTPCDLRGMEGWQGEWVPGWLGKPHPASCPLRQWWCKAEGAVGPWQPQQGFKSHGGHQRILNRTGAREAGKASWATCFGFRCPCHRIMGWKRLLRSSIRLLHHAAKHHCLFLLLLVVQGRSNVTCSTHPVCLAPSVCLVPKGHESRPHSPLWVQVAIPGVPLVPTWLMGAAATCTGVPCAHHQWPPSLSSGSNLMPCLLHVVCWFSISGSHRQAQSCKVWVNSADLVNTLWGNNWCQLTLI